MGIREFIKSGDGSFKLGRTLWEKDPAIPVGVTYENGVPVFHPPKAVSGSEMKSDPRLKRPRTQGGWKVGF